MKTTIHHNAQETLKYSITNPPPNTSLFASPPGGFHSFYSLSSSPPPFLASYIPLRRKARSMEMARPRKTNGIGIGAEDTQICVVMVGLPARGKSLIAQKGELRPSIPLLFRQPRLTSTQPSGTSNGSRSTPWSSTWATIAARTLPGRALTSSTIPTRRASVCGVPLPRPLSRTC